MTGGGGGEGGGRDVVVWEERVSLTLSHLFLPSEKRKGEGVSDRRFI